MNMQSTVIKAIDEASLNRGLSGANWLSDRRNIACVSENGDVTLFDYEGDKTIKSMSFSSLAGVQLFKVLVKVFKPCLIFMVRI